jgi:hypothetical protein
MVSARAMRDAGWDLGEGVGRFRVCWSVGLVSEWVWCLAVVVGAVLGEGIEGMAWVLCSCIASLLEEKSFRMCVRMCVLWKMRLV